MAVSAFTQLPDSSLSEGIFEYTVFGWQMPLWDRSNSKRTKEKPWVNLIIVGQIISAIYFRHMIR
jgi:hypothetical protein